MGLFSFLSVKNKSTETVITPAYQPVACDDSKIPVLTNLFRVPRGTRDNKWVALFYQHVPTAAFMRGNPEVITGPDGMPYFVLKTPGNAGSFEPICIQNIKDDFLLNKGYGVVINPTANDSDWVFSNGDIVNLSLNNEFISSADATGVENIEMTSKVRVVKTGEQVLIAQPCGRYLPKPTRLAIKKFLQSNGIKRPMVMLLCMKENGATIQKLAFNVHPEDFPSDEERNYLIERIAWFLPRHYIIVTFSKKADFAKNFADL